MSSFSLPPKIVDAARVVYGPRTLSDWDNSAPPGDLDDALDQLASRVTTDEALIPLSIGNLNKPGSIPAILADPNGAGVWLEIEEADLGADTNSSSHTLIGFGALGVIKKFPMEELVSRGTSFPGSPSDGFLYYRTDLDDLFFFDGTRSKWLSTWTGVIEMGARTAATTVNYAGAGLVASAQMPLEYDCTVIGYSFDLQGTAASGTLKIVKNGSAFITVVVGSAAIHRDMTEDHDASQDDWLRGRHESMSASVKGIARVFYKRRAS